MRVSTTFKMPFRRRREGKTNYRKRLALLKSGKIRMVVRKSNTRIYIQFIQYDRKGDRTLVSVNSSSLLKFGFPAKRNTPSAYLTGLYAGKLALEKNIKEAIVDINTSPTKGAIVFSAVKGAIDAGLSIPFGDGKVDESRIRGEHLSEEIQKKFEEVKKKIIG